MSDRYPEMSIDDLIPESETETQSAVKHRTSWTPESAMTTDWTPREQSVPDTSDYDNWTAPFSITIHDELKSLVKACRQKYKIRTPAHTVKRLHRYGLQQIVIEWESELTELKSYQAAATEMREHIQGGHQYDKVSSTKKLAVDWGSYIDDPSWRIIWHQKSLIKKLSEVFGINNADVYRWSIMITGDGLGEQEKIGPGLHDDIEDILEEIEYRIADHTKERKKSVKMLAFNALQGKYGNEASKILREKYPTLLKEITDLHETTDTRLEDGGSEEDSSFLADELKELGD